MESYQKLNLVPPSDLEHHQWGFVFFDASADIRMRRHMAFMDPQELAAYVKSLVPAHVYYSTAYYQTPAASTMIEKHWAGADLIFDLDADQIVRGPDAHLLARVREETVKLDRMLIDEPWFSKYQIRVAFSGGRGYNIHVTDIAVRGWGGPERREIVDYVCGIGIDPEVMLAPRAPSTAWRRRYTGVLRDHLTWLAGLEAEEAGMYIGELGGIGKKAGQEFFGNLERIRRGSPSSLLQNRVARAIMDSPGFASRVRDAGARADEPVTTDIKRLIRTPGSLHGGSGMRVVPLDIRDLADFDPLIDAVVFGEREVRVDMKMNFTTSLLGSTYTLKAGLANVPEALAVFLCCRNIAEIAGGV